MHWLDQHAGSIQAISSIVGATITAVLALVTYWYVRVTRDIARSSAEQVKHIKEAAQIARQQNARALGGLALRLRVSLGSANLDSDSPRDNQLRAFVQVTNGDVADVESLSRNLDNTEISTSANQAVAALREVVGFIQKV